MRKGVSPVVAIVLLIAIAVIAAVAVWFWVSPLTGRPATAQTTQRTISIENCWATGSSVSLLARNSGGLAIDADQDFDVYVASTGSQAATNCHVDVDASGIESGNAEIIMNETTLCDGVSPGASYFLRATGYPDAPFTC